MRNFLLIVLILSYGLSAFANCGKKINGYKIVKNSIYPFIVGKDKACFFAFYIRNIQSIPGVASSGNSNDNTLWYGYYKINNPTKIYEFPKPKNVFWRSVCHMNAVSFIDMDHDNIREVTIIGSCNRHDNINYRYPFVFHLHNDRYVLNENVYNNLYGFIDLSISDVKNYIENPQKYYALLWNRYKIKPAGK